jgi:hypothetical protein
MLKCPRQAQKEENDRHPKNGLGNGHENGFLEVFLIEG